MRAGQSVWGKWIRETTRQTDAEIKVAGQTETPAVAVLKIAPLVPFQIGWRTADDQSIPEFYNVPAQTDQNGRLAMKVGNEAVRFVVRPLDQRTPLTIELVELLTQDDIRYGDTPWY